MSFDVASIRAQFPILGRPPAQGAAPRLFDTAASAQKPQCVIDKEQEVYETCYANAYRGVYASGRLLMSRWRQLDPA